MRQRRPNSARSRGRLALLAAFVALPTPRAGAQSPASAAAVTRPPISAEDLRTRLFLVAHDSMMGRRPGELGNYKATDYIAGEFRRLGLEPAGEDNTYFQTVPFVTMAPDTTSLLSASPAASGVAAGASGGARLAFGSDFLLAAVPTTMRTLSGTPVVYGGSTDDPTSWVSAEAASGAVVVLDNRASGGSSGGMRSLQRVFRDPRFARAALIAVDMLENVPGETRAAIESGRLTVDTTRNATVPPFALVSHRAARAMLGADPATLTPGAPGVTVSGRVGFSARPVAYAARNVVAILRGSDPALRHQYVALTAHNDHVGFDHAPVDHDSLRAFNRVIRPMGADSPQREPAPDEAARITAIRDSLRAVHTARPDSIRNGADDDGSGTVSLLEIAEAMVREPKPRRSILFVSHTGEESGLVGSAWFTDHATVPTDSIVAEIDQDMVGRGTAQDLPEAGPEYLEVIGAKRISKEFGEILEATNAAQPKPFVFNYTYDQPGHPLQYYCRADHYSYARYGIPSVALSRGEHLDYHQVTDEPQYIDYDDMVRVTRLVHDAALRIANLDHRPTIDVPKGDPHAPCRQ